MKKIFTLILALMAFVMGSQTARATLTQPLEVTLKSGMFLSDAPQAAFAVKFLSMVNQVESYPIGDFTFVYSLDDKLLMTIVNETSQVTLAARVNTADDITYYITDADREAVREKDAELFETSRKYNYIHLHFDVTELKTYETTLTPGKLITIGSKDYYAIFSLVLFGQVKAQGYSYCSSNDKILFTISPAGDENNPSIMINLAQGVSSADDITYTITDEGRTYLEEEVDDPFFAIHLADVKTIHVHFDASGGGNVDPSALAGTIKNGMNLQNVDYETQMVFFFLNIFNQLRREDEVDENDDNTGRALYFSKANKLLLIQDDKDILTIADGVTSADDIIYTITQEDRDWLLEEDDETYAFLAPYKTIELHFDTSGGSGGDAGENDLLLNRYLLTFESVGQTFQLEAKVLPEDVPDKTVTWKSDNENVVTVSASGLVTAVGNGKAKIRATAANNCVKECDVVVKIITGGKLGTQGTWRFEDGVLTIDYVGQMPWDCTSKTTDPEIAYRLKWIDFLSEIKEIVITGEDVEIQPYFLYYSGDGDLGQHPDDHVRTLTLGSGVKKVGKQALALYDLKRVNCYGIEPPELSSDTGGSNCFWKRRIQENNAFLYLPANASIGYARIASEWAFFNHSASHLDMDDDPVGIKRVTEDTERTEDTENLSGWYSLDGRRLDSKPTQKGIYIVRCSDRTSKKVLVK